MDVTPKQILLQQANPVANAVTASARAESNAKPQDLLGADPQKRIQYSTELAAALQGHDAALRDARLTPPGSFINTRA